MAIIDTIQNKSKAPELQALGMINGVCRVLLVAQRLARKFVTIVTLADFPVDTFVRAISAYAHAHIDVGALNLLFLFKCDCRYDLPRKCSGVLATGDHRYLNQ